MSEPIRILHVVGGLGVGGIQSFLMSLYRSIDRSRVQFDFVVHIKEEKSYADEVTAMGGRVFYIDNDAFEKKRWSNYISFWKRFFREHPEYRIVHGHLRTTSAIYLRRAKKAGCYTIAHSHATSNGYGRSAKLKDLLQQPTRRIADYFMGCSVQANEWMFGEKIVHGSSCMVVKNGINAEKYAFDPQTRAKVRQALNLPDDAFVIGTVGRMVAQKNQELLIRAAAQAKQERPALMLLLVGDGPLLERLKALAEKLQLGETVRFLGSRSDVCELLQAFDAFAISSRNEGLGIAAVEAQAADLPVLISPAIPREACITGNIIPVGSYDVDMWARAFAEVKARTRADMRKAVGDAGYDIRRIADELSRFYESKMSVKDDGRSR